MFRMSIDLIRLIIRPVNVGVVWPKCSYISQFGAL